MYVKNLIGQTFNDLKLIDKEIRPIGNGKNRTYYLCHCNNCGNEKWIRADAIGKIKACGCKQSQTQFAAYDITGNTYNHLKAIKPTDKRDKNGSVIWEFECLLCGNHKDFNMSSVMRGKIKSCGCLLAKARSISGKQVGEKIKNEFCIDHTNVNNLTDVMLKNNTSGYKGVTWKKDKNKWCVQIWFKGKRYFLGYYKKDDVINASKAYQEAKKNLHEDFLRWYEVYLLSKEENMEQYIYKDKIVVKQHLPEETSFLELLKKNNVPYEKIKRETVGMLQEIEIISYLKDGISKYAYIISIVGADSWAQTVYITETYFDDYVNMIKHK